MKTILEILDKHIPEFSNKVKTYVESRLTKTTIASEIEAFIKENYVEKHNLTDAEIETEANQYAIHHSAAPDKDCPTWIIADFEAGAKWARMKTIGVIQDLTIKKKYYPKEFVEWVCEKGTIQQEEQPNIWLNTLDELHEYWLTNIKDK